MIIEGNCPNCGAKITFYTDNPNDAKTECGNCGKKVDFNDFGREKDDQAKENSQIQ